MSRTKAAKSDAEKENGKQRKSAKGKAATAPAEGKAKGTISISWAKAENHHFTSALLTAIEVNNTWIVAFGFNKGAAGTDLRRQSTITGKRPFKKPMQCSDRIQNV
ncbi:hypothetical protein AX15_006349 [Amanita polypyramis BW_CC]|nr:hypothetical protein AX15_006349 [Amanita polypyramis BW_CC]